MSAMSSYDELKRRAKDKRSVESSGGSSYDDIKESAAQKRYSQEVGNVDDAYINSFLEDANSYVSDSKKVFDNITWASATSASDRESRYAKTQDLGYRAKLINYYLENNKDRLDSNTYSNLTEALGGYQNAFTQVDDVFDQYSKHFSKWGSEEEYNTAVRYDGYSKKYEGKTSTELQSFIDSLEDGEEKEWLKSYASTVDYDEKAAYDLEAAQKEIDKLEKQKAELFQKYRGILASKQSATTYLTGPNGSPQTSGNYIGKIEGEESDVIRQMKYLEDEINQKKQYLNLADRVQYGIKLSSVADPNSANYDPEFSNYTGFIADEESPLGVNPNLHYAYINDSTLGDKNVRDMLGFGDWTRLNHLTEDETAIYNYYYNKHGEEAAKEYLDYLTESLDYRKAKHNFENEYQGNRLKELMFAFEAGIDQFSSGIKNLFNDDDYIPTSYTQALSGMVREDLADVDLKWYNFKEGEWDDANIGGSSLGQSLYDTVTTTANMAPSILVSYAVGLLNPTLGAAAGSTLLGGSAAGNAYANALQQGYTKDQAKTYGTFVGASEGLLQYFIGGISSLGGLSGKFANKIAAIDRAGLRAAAKLGISIAGETLEEELQNYLEPAFRTIIFGEDYDAPTIDQIIETAFVTFLSTGFLEGGSAISQTRAEEAYKREYGGEANTLIQKGLENDIDTEGFNLAVKYRNKVSNGKNLTGAEIRNLLEANRKHITADDMNKIQKAAEERLKSLGQTENVSKIAKLATKHAMGQELTREEKSILANSEYGSRVAKELLPENFLSEEHDTEWAEDIDTTIVNRNAYNLKKTKAQIKEIVERAAKMNNPSTYKSLSDRIGEDEKVSVSDNGKATVNGEEINLNKKVEVVDFVKDKKTGKITDIIINANGKQVKASEIDFADADQAYLFSAVKHIENITPADAQVIIRDYDPSSGISVGEYLNGIDEAYTYGYHNYTEADMKSGLFTTKLSDEKSKGAYELGKLAKKNNKEAKSEAIKRMRTAVEAEAEKAVAEGKPAPEPKKMAITYNKGNGVVTDFEKTGMKLSKKQRAGVEVAKILHKLGLGANFEFFESMDKDGHRVFINEAGVEENAPAGVYSLSDGTIRIDLNAYNGRQLTLYTLSHELTHFIQQWSTEKYEVLAEYLVSTYEKTGLTMHQRVLREQARLKGIRGEEISYNEAYDEVVANAMMKMFDDGNLVQRLTELKAKDKNLAMKLWEGFKEIINKLLGVYQSDPGVFYDTEDLMQMKEDFEVLQGMFAEALVEASENFQAAQTIGFDLDAETESISPAVMKSEQTWTESDYVQQRDNAAKEIAKAIGVSVKKAKDYIDSVNSIAKMIAEDRSRLDYFSSPGRSSFVDNAEYGGSFDFSTLCKKRRLLTGTFTAIQKALPNTALTANEILDIRNRMKEAGLEVSCGLCYVEGSRANMGQFAKEFLRLYKQYYPDAWQPNMADVNTPDGIEWVRINHPECYEQYEYFWNHYGTLKDGDKNLFASQQKPKLYQLHTEYKGEILNKFKNDDKVEDKNLNGGIRLQSFSDFEIVHLIDTMQIIMDMSRVGLAGQAYTKVPDFAWALGDTGLKINLSLIAKGVDENGKLIFDDVEGMPIADAMKLRDRYSKNVGTILVAFNDAQLLAAMADERVDFIIPFHRSQWKKSQYEAMGLPAKTKDYTFMQNEKFIKPTYHEYRGRMVKDKATNYMPNEYWDFSKSGKENAKAYLEMCARNNKRPKFYKLLTDNGNGSYSLKADGSTDGYWKLLIDFKMYDNDGNGSPQMAVKPDFNMQEATRMLNDYSGGHSNFPVAQGIVDSFVKDYKDSHKGEQYSSQETDADVHPQRVTNKELSEMDDTALYIKNTSKANYIDMIFNGAKTEETRSRRTLDAFIGKDFYVTDGKYVYGSIVLGEPHQYTEEEFHKKKNQLKHRVPVGDKYDIKTGGTKWAYPIESYKKFDKPKKLADSTEYKNSFQAREVLYSSQETDTDFLAEGKLKGNYTVSEISEMFDAWNSDPEVADLSKKVFAKLQEIMDEQDKAYWATPYPIRFRSEEYLNKTHYIAPNGIFDPSRTDGNYGITYNLDYFRKTSDQDKARVLLHEAIHACTVGAIKSTERRIPKYADPIEFTPDDSWSDAQKASLELIQVFYQVRVANERNEYGQKNVYEMVAEMSNPEFRAMLKKENLWGRIVNAIKRIFGIEQKTAYDSVSSALDKILELDMSKKANEVYSTQETDNISNRDMLANAFETLAQNSEEYKMIQKYKNHIRLLNEYEDKLSKLNAEIYKMTFGNDGNRDSKKLRELQAKAKEVAGNINRHDRELLNLEASEPLRKVIQQERKKEAQKTREHIGEIMQNKKARAEHAEYRHKIRKAVRDLDKLLNRGNKKTNVKEDMKGFVSKALELADFIFTDHVSNDDLIRKGITVRMTPREEALVRETEDILSQLYDNSANLTSEEYARLDAKRKSNMDKLRDLLTDQRNERLNTPVYNLFNDLVTEYAGLKNSSQDAVKAAYDPVVEMFLRNYVGESNGETDSDRKTLLQNMRVADMTTKELEHLLYAYKMVLTSVRKANELHIKGKAESIQQVADSITLDFTKRKTPDKKVATVIRNISNKMGWDYEKLYYALDRIGSEAFTELVMNIANSENIVMQDVIEAALFRDEMVKKYGFNKWDVNKKIDREFLDTTGKKFEMTLGQLMSLYAYSRRDGAWDHIEYGGFVFGEKALTNPKPADSYKLTKDQCEAITNTLTKEQKGYVEDMQKFLSETMGEKGNEVSMLLYGIKMFGEKNYFPIHVAGEYMANAQESKAKEAAGFSSMTSAGFTKAQNPNAKAPFVLEGFNEIWADHVNEMSRYHGTVPALEDFRRVMNRSTYSDSTADSISLRALMENSYGKEAVDYFDNLYKEANSGAIRDKLEKKSQKLLSLFRKNSVAYSLSVLIQQPASIVRAYALIDKKYFGIKGFGAITSGVAKAVSDRWTKAHTNAYNEMLKYAPGVTMAKEIGGFDTATGGSIRSYLLDTDKGFFQSMKTENLKGKAGAAMDLVDDNAIANLPNLADKIAWIEIWNACKRETAAKHKDLATSSEEFMKIVGERFTEVIRATQVYDSIFAKSPMLKSKNPAVQYLVSFMNEPNAVANMAESAVRDAARGNWKGGVRKAGTVIYSIIFTNVLKSLIYAMRDDDEEETYIEKYIEAITGGLMDDFNALNYIPLVRDAWSVAQGYDVERTDMAIISDAISALNNVIKNATKDTGDMTEDELAEFEKKSAEATWQLVGSLASFFGIPVKNVRREIKGVLDHARIASANAGMTTAQSVWDKIQDSVIEWIPFMQNDRTKGDKLYDAIINGDTAYANRLKDTYKTDESYHNAVRKALRENDSRIKEAALAEINGNPSERVRIQKLIMADGFDQDDVVAATNSEIADLTPDKEDSGTDKKKGFYTTDNLVREFANGDTTSAKAAKSDIISTAIANGKTKEQAEKDFMSNVSSSAREAYEKNWLSESKAKKLLMEYAGEDEDGATSKVNYWTLCKLYPNYKDLFTEARTKNYHEYVKPAGISMDTYVKFLTKTNGLSDIKDANGKVKLSKQDQVIDVIDAFPITRRQKNALFLAAGYKESTLSKVRWS